MLDNYDIYIIDHVGGYVFIRANQIIGGTKIFLVLEDITTSLINQVLFVYQVNGSVSLTLQTPSHTIWSSASNPGAATGVGNWRQVRLYGSSFISDSPITLQFVATTGSPSNGFAAVDDLIVQVKTQCNYDSLSDPG